MPIGPCSLWPQDRHVSYLKSLGAEITYDDRTGRPRYREQIIAQAVQDVPKPDGTYERVELDTFELQLEHNEQMHQNPALLRAGAEPLPDNERATKVKASAASMAKGLVKNMGTAIMKGKVNKNIRDKRMATCEACPSLIKKTKRCAECGCFMTAKTWLAGDPNLLCPLKKWEE